ncbi:hypothetical protein V6N13_140728 [Hibiscus sabdariffa]
MASYKILAFAALFLILLPIAVNGAFDDLSPALAPFYENLCDHVECGRGTCRPDRRYPLSYICDCDLGWTRTRDGRDDNDNNLKFLPCVIPNCTLNYSCQPAPPPLAIGLTVEKEPATKQIHTSMHANADLGTLGSDCSRLGITVGDQQATPNGGKANIFLPGKLHWVAILMMSMAMVLWK